MWKGEDKTRPSPQPPPSAGGYVVWILKIGLAHCIIALDTVFISFSSFSVISASPSKNGEIYHILTLE